MGAHSERIVWARAASQMTAEQIRAEKNARTKARNLNRKKEMANLVEEKRRERARRTPKQQLAELDQRLGVGVGAKRERARLLQQCKELDELTKLKEGLDKLSESTDQNNVGGADSDHGAKKRARKEARARKKSKGR